MKKIFFYILLLSLSLGVSAQDFIDYNKNGKQDIFENSAYSIEERVENLLNQMTFEEKQGQLLMDLGWQYYQREASSIVLTPYALQTLKQKLTGSLWGFFRADPWSGKTLESGINPLLSSEGINRLQRFVIDSTRLGIPVLIAEECMHGIMQVGSTVFPTALGQAASWNADLVLRMAETIGAQAQLQGINICFGPMLDLAKDPRWSRVEETFGEDTYLVSIMGSNFVKGLKNNGHETTKTLLPTLKHFAAYGNSEGGHNAGSSHLWLRELHSEVLPPFSRAIKSGADLVMTAYKAIDGVPCTMNSYLLKDVLRRDWAFKGVVISDLHSVSGLISHGVAADLKQAAEKSFNAGVDLDLSATDFYSNLSDIDTVRLNEAVRRVLRLKFICGLMDSPFIEETSELYSAPAFSQADETALRLAEESLVLLENKDNILPLNADKSLNIALIGPNADNIYNQLGDYTGPQTASSVITLRNAFEKEAKANGNIKIHYAKGCSVRDKDKKGFAQALKAAKKSDVIVLCLGGSSSRYEETEYESTGAAKVVSKTVSDMTCGEGFDRSSLDLPGVQKDLLFELAELNKPIVLVLINGRPLVLTDIKDKCNSLLECFYPGSQGGEAIKNTILGKNNPSGHLPVSFPRSVGALPCFYNAKRVADRSPYVEESAEALYPFGYGLTYTEFSYSDLRLKLENEGTDSVFALVNLKVRNTGERDGSELVQIYIKKTVSNYAAPVKTLCAFAKKYIPKGKTEDFTLKIDNDFFRERNLNATEFSLSGGEYEIMVGYDGKMNLKFNVSGD